MRVPDNKRRKMKQVTSDSTRVNSQFQTNLSGVPYKPLATSCPRRDTLTSFSKAEQHGGWCGCLQPVFKLISSICRYMCSCFCSGPKKEVLDPRITVIFKEDNAGIIGGESFNKMGSLIRDQLDRFQSHISGSQKKTIGQVLDGQDRQAALIVMGYDGMAEMFTDTLSAKFIEEAFSNAKELADKRYADAPLKNQTFSITFLLLGEPTSEGKQMVYSWNWKNTILPYDEQKFNLPNELDTTKTVHCFVGSKDEARKYVQQTFTPGYFTFPSHFIQ
jgi:hypothetical protein